MNILIIEDDVNKSKQIADFMLSKQLGDIEIAKSYQGGLKAILTGRYDLIILDMSLPTFDIKGRETGGPYRSYAGEEILSEMERKNIFCDVIVITQYENFGEGKDYMTLEQLRERLKKNYLQNYRSTIFYSAAEANWKEELDRTLSTIGQES